MAEGTLNELVIVSGEEMMRWQSPPHSIVMTTCHHRHI